MGHKVPRQRGEGRGELEEISQRTYMLICIAHGHKQPGGEGRGGWVERAKGGKWETPAVVPTIQKRLQIGPDSSAFSG